MASAPYKPVAEAVPDLDEESSFDDGEAAPDAPVSAADLANICTVDVRGQQVTICYDLGEMTPRVRKKLGKLKSDTTDDSEAAVDAMIEFLAAVVTEWDLTDKAGLPVAVTVAGIEGLSYKDIGLISGAVIGTKSPN